jgi:hypothetical protein
MIDVVDVYQVGDEMRNAIMKDKVVWKS